MMRKLLSLYVPSYPQTLVYMLQNTDYTVGPYLRWYWRVGDFSHVRYRRELALTHAARLLVLALDVGIVLEITLGLLLLYLWATGHLDGGWAFGSALIVAYPVVWAHLVTIPLLFGRIVIVAPRTARAVRQSEAIFRAHPAEKIAIVGSYGKTSMKELLLTVLGAGKKVAATPANQNVASSHASFARSLRGGEDIVLIEYGEGRPGDVAKFAQVTHPSRAVITGVAAAHLDKYSSTVAAGQDIFSIANFITDQRHLYVNAASLAAAELIRPGFTVYDQRGALGWKVANVQVTIDGVAFSLRKGSMTLKLRSALLGRHNLGPLSLAAALAHEFGMKPRQIEQAIAKTAPFEHRMQPYQLNGAWVIDDTYNGNIEGIRAGTALLKELPAKRKLYVTPGLVDQGAESQSIHEQMGRLIADSGADLVVLMQNSVTAYIEAGLKAADFPGEVTIEPRPLEFYANLNQFVATGDLVMMQNDWPDNYA